VSACLLGEEVRFDGGHKRDAFVTEILAPFVTFVPICPEVEIGLGIPRESLRLVRSDEGLRLIMPRSGRDLTEAMRRYGAAKAGEIAGMDLSGYILKKDSPSCGMERVRAYDRNGVPTKSARGLFAEALLAAHPLLPVEEEGRLRDPWLRENFIERVFAFRRLKNFFASPFTLGDLVAFHSREKLLLLAHEPAAYEELGRLVAHAKGRAREELGRSYQARFMAGMGQIATTRKQTNVLQHMQGYFKKVLDAAEKAELSALIQDYRAGLVPLVVPLTLIRHYVRMHGVEYLLGQTYLEPHPKELMLRNHV
jgi:uncharacterized protein YbgA (DUF1722 family)/uncharacterized protein YbbK (DUF523 family)